MSCFNGCALMIVYRISHPPSRAAPPTDGAEKSLNLIKKKNLPQSRQHVVPENGAFQFSATNQTSPDN